VTPWRRNGEGYSDPTAAGALADIDGPSIEETRRFRKLLELIFGVCEIAGFHIEERIVLKDKKTGRVWR
jgi:hypothetical protein